MNSILINVAITSTSATLVISNRKCRTVLVVEFHPSTASQNFRCEPMFPVRLSPSHTKCLPNILYDPVLKAAANHLKEHGNCKKLCKSDKDPAEWLPPKSQCVYAQRWVAVKYRWGLSIDLAEKQVLSRLLSGQCGEVSANVGRFG